MSLEAVLKFAFYAAKKHPRVLLPSVIGWIPVVLTILALALVLPEFSPLRFFAALRQPQALLPALQQFSILITVLSAVYWLASAFLRTLYADVTNQFAKRKRPDIAKSFYAAKRSLTPMLWVDFLIALVIVGIFVANIALLYLLMLGTSMAGWMPAQFMALAIMVAFAGFAATLYVLIKSWLTPVLVVIEDRRGWDAVRRSFALTQDRFWHVMLVWLVIIVFTILVNGALNAVPLVGFSLVMLASLFLTMWNDTAPAAFYFEYGLGKKK